LSNLLTGTYQASKKKKKKKKKGGFMGIVAYSIK
jgi:hypothetical protein